MNNYIVIQRESAKAPLKAASKTGISKLKFGHGRVAEYTAATESELCSMIYTSNLHYDLARWLNSWFDCLGPDEIDDFHVQFKKAHPLTKIEGALENIPVVATKDSYCELSSPMLKDDIKLTLQQEEGLLRIITTRRIPSGNPIMQGIGLPSIWAALEDYFSRYCQKYGVLPRLKRDEKNLSHELVWHFCLLHGIDMNYLNQKSIKINGDDFTTSVGMSVLVLSGLTLLITTGVFILVVLCKLM